MRWLQYTVFGTIVLVHLIASLPISPDSSVVQGTLPQQATVEEIYAAEPSPDVTRDKRTIGPLRQLFPGLSEQTALNPEENQLAGAESQQHEVRVQYVHPSPINDLQAAATGDGEDEDSEVAASEDADAQESEDPRNKRFLPFNFGASASGTAGGGSGNFLFDLLRLVTSSSGNTDSSEESHASLTGSAEAGVSVGKGDGYEPGIPGPVTRLLVIANRGIANLIQDLILRLAQTSERIVNFKARLITSII